MDTVEFANMLIEAERAGGLALTELLEIAEAPLLRETLRKVAHDEGYWAHQLAGVVSKRGQTPTTITGDFAAKIRAVPALAGKLSLLNRGQGWVVRQIDGQLPNESDPAVAGLLQAMAAAHRSNIALVDEVLRELGA